MTAPDEFKYTACSITVEECCEFYCFNCSVAKEHLKKEKEFAQLKEIENFTVFARCTQFCGRDVAVNDPRTIARITLEDLKHFQEKHQVTSIKTGYSPVALKQYQKSLRKLRIHNKLPIPDGIWIEKDWPGVFQFGNKYYLIAPMIETNRRGLSCPK